MDTKYWTSLVETPFGLDGPNLCGQLTSPFLGVCHPSCRRSSPRGKGIVFRQVRYACRPGAFDPPGFCSFISHLCSMRSLSTEAFCLDRERESPPRELIRTCMT